MYTNHVGGWCAVRLSPDVSNVGVNWVHMEVEVVCTCW